MPDERTGFESRRRTFLKSIGAVGVTAVGSSVATAQESSDSLDDYHQTLRDDLTGRGGNRTLPAGEYVYGTTEEAALEAFSLQGDGETSTISVDTDTVPITTAERLDVSGSGDRPYEVSYRGPVEDRSLSEGDLLLGVAYVRSDSDHAQAKASFNYEYTDTDGETSYSDSFVQRGAEMDPTDEWLRYFFPIEVGAKPDGTDHAPFLEFWTGYGDQTVEFGGMALIDYSDDDVDLATLPPYDYEGRSPDAEWREDARERIEEIRKTDVEVEVLGPGGKSMNRAGVEVEMQDHEFDFGSAVSVNHITGDEEADEIYRETFLEYFNRAVVENGLKYPAWEGGWDMSQDDIRSTLDWLDERDVPTRGHYLLWEEYTTDGGGGMYIENADELSTDEIEELVAEKIRNHAEMFEDDVADWDMHNHPIWQRNFRDTEGLGWDAIDHWWQAANEVTDNELYTNEMGAIGGAWQRSQYLDYIEHLVENDYPVDGIGFMGHHQQQWNQMLPITGDRSMEEGFDAFADFDLPLLITEFDIEIFSRRNAQDVAVQADYTRDFLTMAFSKEAVEGVMSWGFWEEDHWRPTGAYFDSDWTLRENGEVFKNLVFDEWWTHERGRTDHDGVYETRGFRGDYVVRAKKGALTGETTVTFDDETDTVTVELSPSDDSDSDGDESDDDVECGSGRDDDHAKGPGWKGKKGGKHGKGENGGTNGKGKRGNKHGHKGKTGGKHD
jgi:GH35 family endo-1,4-beta-xylanase